MKDGRWIDEIWMNGKQMNEIWMDGNGWEDR